MTSQAPLIPDSLKQVRRKILKTASEARVCLDQISLEASAFPHLVTGFSLLEKLNDDQNIRWMGAESRFRISPEVSRFQFTVRSPSPENHLTVEIDGIEIGRWKIADDWIEGDINLPGEGEGVRTLILKSSKLADAPDDPRELGLMFRHLDIGQENVSPHSPGIKITIPQLQSSLSVCNLPDIPSSPLIRQSNKYPKTPLRSAVISLKYFRPHDAISHEAITMGDLLRDAGFTIHFLAEETHPEYCHLIGSPEELKSTLNDSSTLLVHHHGTHWPYGDQLFLNAPVGARLLRYHNVSLSECFLDYPNGYLDATIEGRFDTIDLVPSATFTAAASYWALSDLVATGADPEKIRYLPFLHDLEALENLTPNQEILRKMNQMDTIQLLVIGRQVPSKGLHHVLRVFREYRRHFHEKIHVWIVGAVDPLLQAYHEDLQNFVSANDLSDSVTFEADADRASIAAYLRGCDALITMSESDAASIPILEAAWLEKPTLGLNRGGKGEHAGPGQLLFDSLDYRLHAEAWHQFITQPELRSDLGNMAQRHVKARFNASSVHNRFLELITELNQNPPANQPQADSDHEN